MFDLMTDILADLILNDMKQFPQIPVGSHIDSGAGRENTMLLTQEDGNERRDLRP